MRISRVTIKNYRNLKDVDIQLENLVTLIGENNGGKSNFLRALTLPLLSDEAALSKQLSWYDINHDAKNDFYKYVSENRDSIVKGTLDVTTFLPHIPMVTVKLEMEPADTEHYDIKDILAEENDGTPSFP